MNAQLDEILERDLQKQVFDLAQQTGWKRGYHTFDSRRSASGFPDIVLVRERIVFLELKREKTRLTAEQRGWLEALHRAGAETYVIRPRHLEQIATVLAARKRDGDFHSNQTGEHARRAAHELLVQLGKELA